MKNKVTKPFFVANFYPVTSALMLALVAPNMAQANHSGDLISLTNNNFQQSVSGSVSSSSGPLSGVTIYVKENSTIATSTDKNGYYSLNVKTGQTLVFSAIGFNKVEKLVQSATLNVTLEESNESLEEVVIVGYGTQQKKESLTGALQTVKGDKLRDVTSPSVENMLNGKAAGVYVAPGTGRPGARGGVVIRGQATLSGTTSPLWVIDGVIVGSSAGDLNPDDIASLTILKDAASTAIYGSQGANGVVVVTTKNPSAQKTAINFSTKMGFNQLTNGNLEMMNGAELYDYYASFANASSIKFPRWNEDLRNSDFDWWKLATKNGFTQNHNLSIQGGTEKLQSFMSLGYYNEVGAVKGYDFDRYNFRLNTVYKPFEWLTIKPTIVGARRGVEDKQYSTTAMYSNFPWDSPFDTDGNLVPHRYSGWVNSASTNYLYDLQWDHAANTNYEFNGSMDFDIKFTNWLTFSSVNNYRYNTFSAAGYTDPRSNGGESVQGRLTDYRSEYARRYTNQILRFNKTWGKHALTGLAAYEFNDYWTKTLDVYGTGFIPGFEVLDVVAKPERTKGGISEWAVQSILSNANYAYDGKYLGQVSFRRDGASNFGDNAKYGNFFSVSGGWNINRESWFKADWVDALKLRASYGSVGNRPSSLYPQYSLYSVSATSGYNEYSGALISQIGNKDLTWERTFTSGVGVDAALFNNRARFSVDYYNKKTDNILYNVPISGLTGVTAIWKNIGKMQNRGVELTLGGDIIRKNDLTWSLDINLGHNKNKLTELYKSRDASGNYIVKPIIIGDGLGIAGSASRVLDPGYPVDTYYMPIWAGVNPDNGAPMWYKVGKDAEGNETQTTTSKYSEATLKKAGKASPDLFGGINTGVTYKQFDLSAVFGYSIGGKIYNYSRQEYDSDGTYTDRNQMKLQDGWTRWEKPGDVATHPIAKYNNNDKGNSTSTRYLEDSDFFRMRSLTLGYNFKLDQYHIKNVRVFFAGENLFTITKYSGVDPEISINEDSGAVLGSAGPSVYPATRKFMFGLNVTF
ncbi:SusC/RagA family TonB-linked outer membrane protein [Sphingobacterium sp. SRCM116780]|uniref:SusC/RagA family TonB-linked outer membrane protein n=1 Tax=Sphingobacterium sp. SRCM116780 TaxID=2907623 RepID=UPI001F455292|nr:SusC/RagA family TonB-linked outer membrane protein [Sphingobacterium sp. SRCM116780]UIR56247.1 SusC/RagA family TonB-linked outer membrane protein [Sphingobacterium sp. SRCM116780]